MENEGKKWKKHTLNSSTSDFHFANASYPAQRCQSQAHQQHDHKRARWHHPMTQKEVLNCGADENVIRCAKTELGKGNLPSNQEIAIDTKGLSAQQRIRDVVMLVALTQQQNSQR